MIRPISVLFFLILFLLAGCSGGTAPATRPLPTRIPLLPTLTPTPRAGALGGAGESLTTFGMGAGGSERGAAVSAASGEQVDLYAMEAPEFPPDLEWLNTEQPLSLAQLRGKIVLLDFWTYGCVNCLHNIPYLKQLEARYPDELVVIGVHSAKFATEGQTENIRQVILRYGLEHPVVNDKDLRVWHRWNVKAWPTLVLIDPAGNLAGLHVGENFYGPFNTLIRQLIDAFDARGLLDRTPLRFRLEREGLPQTILSFPGKVLADARGNRLFIADTNHNRIVIADRQSGEVLALAGSGADGFADGDYATAAFAWPQGM
ncbi:MAG: hypothetical protein D6790_09720, partial [Caldilineae bacterium]